MWEPADLHHNHQTAMIYKSPVRKWLSHTCHGAGAAMGPAGATVLGNVLVASCADVVGAIDVPPVPGLRQIRYV